MFNYFIMNHVLTKRFGYFIMEVVPKTSVIWVSTSYNLVKVKGKGHWVVSMVCACNIDIGQKVKVESKGHGVVSMVCACNIYI